MKKLLLFLLISFTANQLVLAQPKPAAKPIARPPIKIKFKGKTYWNNYTDSATVTPEEAIALLSQPIVAKDSKNTTLVIVSYQFLYKRLGVTEDEETGKTSPATTIVSRRFEKTPLPELWQRNITEQLHSGEELEFFDVVIKNPTGAGLTLSTSLKIKIK
jgi:hypothetical protein